jgi:Domain of unknown function (DUF4760)
LFDGADKMSSGIKNLLAVTWRYATPWDRLWGIGVIFLVLLGSIFWLKQDPLLLNYRAVWCIAITLLYFAAIVPPVKRMARRKHELLVYVAVWGIISLILWLASFYATFFFLVVNTDKWDKILNLPPVFAAIIGAGIGWYVHQELSAKFHRTSNSFNLVMQTRTSAEFIRYTRDLYAYYSKCETLPDEVVKCDLPAKRIELGQRKRELEANPQEEMFSQKKLAYLNDLAMLEAIEGLRYLLNFYEFMSFAIHAGDLDENLLYETVSPSVVRWYNRSKDYQSHVTTNDQGNKLAYQHLTKLVEGYTTMVGSKVTEIPGWERRLDIEKAEKN